MFDDADQLVALFDDLDQRPPERGPVRVARVRVGRATVTVTAERQSLLAASPADPERREPAVCTQVVSHDGSSSSCWHRAPAST